MNEEPGAAVQAMAEAIQRRFRATSGPLRAIRNQTDTIERSIDKAWETALKMKWRMGQQGSEVEEGAKP